MNNFSRNLERVRKRDPDLAARLSAHVKENGIVAPVKDAHGKPNLPTNDKDGWLYGIVDAEIRQLQDSLSNQRNPQTVILMGLGLGYHLHAVLDRAHPLMRYFIIVEPSLEIFCSFLSMVDLGDLMENASILWLVGVPEEELEFRFESMLALPSFAGAALHAILIEWSYRSTSLSSFKSRWTSFIDSLRLRLNVTYFDAYYGFKNFIDNRGRLGTTPLLQEYKDIFKGKPGIIVGSGPSLDHCLDLLRKAEGKAVLCAAASAYPLLLKKGIKPYLTTCLERTPDMKDVFQGEETSEATLVTTPIMHSGVADVFEGSMIYLARRHHFLPAVFPDAEFDDMEVMSVSHAAFQALHYFGCDPIYLVGQDLGLDPKTRETHAKGYIHESLTFDRVKEVNRKTRQVPSNHRDSRLVETWEDWWRFGKIFTDLIRAYGVECYNIIPEDYGIRIEGSVRMNPDAAMNLFAEPVPVKETLEAARSRFMKEKSVAQSEKATAFFEGARGHLEGIKGRCEKSIREVYDFLQAEGGFPSGSGASKVYEPLFHKLEQVALDLRGDPFFAAVIMPITAGKYYRAMMQSHELEAEDPQHPQVLQDRLAVPFYWISDILMRTEMVLRQLETQPAVQRGGQP